jgi:hypothetical protein
MRIPLVLLAALLCAGCGAPSYDVPPETPSDVESETSMTPVKVIVPNGAPSETAEEGGGMDQAQRRDPSRVLVLQTTKLDRYAEVLGPIDVHEPMGSDAAALERLREEAADLGADAIVGVEFHHGDAPGEPTHLSGLAVRFVPPPQLPMH